MRLVILESPYAGNVEENVRYARACMRDCLLRGEAPFASHLLYTQPGVLDDGIPEERALGMEAGLVWGPPAQATVVYTDRGISRGMREGIARAERENRVVEMRTLPGWEPETKKHSALVWVDELASEWERNANDCVRFRDENPPPTGAARLIAGAVLTLGDVFRRCARELRERAAVKS